MSEMVNKTMVGVIKSFDVFCGVVYLIGVVIAVNSLWLQQNNDVKIMQQTKNVQVVSEHLIKISHINTGDVSFTANKNNLLLVRVIKNTSDNHLYVFVHPLWLLVTSPFFLLLTLFFSLGVIATRMALSKAIINNLEQVIGLERWAYLSTTNGKTAPIPNSGMIGKTISAVVEHLNDTKKMQGKSEQLIREQALLDQETGIGNREFFTNRLDALLYEEDAKGAILLLNFSALDVVQSLYGDKASMMLLESAINVIEQKMNNISHYFIARRDTFDIAILIPGIYVKDTEKLADKLLKSLDGLTYPVGINEDETCYMGISCFNAKQQAYKIMAEADMALRSAQLQGPSQWFRYDSGEVVQESAKGSLKWRTFLTRAIENKAFVLFFQPVIENDSDKIIHHEVLSKVRDGKGKLISARVFLPMAQKCGLACGIDMLVFEHICRLIQYEKKQNDICSLNVSVDSLLNDDFIERLFIKLGNMQEVAKQLIIEISEYHLVANMNKLKPVLGLLSELGIKILVDKVGQYVVNTDYLYLCPISYIKLHRSIVHQINLRIENQIFVQSLNSSCAQKNISIYALGVESREEWQTLTRVGVKGGQGHYFTEPVAQMAQAIELP